MVASPHPSLTAERVAAYLSRLGLERGRVAADLASLGAIHMAHLERVPFENLDIVFGNGALHDQVGAVDKIIGPGPDARRGGWCFELNGALALLLETLGFDVRLLGAAVLLGGPSEVIEHLLLEVSSDRCPPQLVDVGFGDSFDLPLALNTAGPQDGGSGPFELIGSPQGTTLAHHVDGVPSALLRFKRVAHSFDDFAPIARSLQTDPTKKWATHPFATRRLTDDEAGTTVAGPQRVTLSHDCLKVNRGGTVDELPVDRGAWASCLMEWFAIEPPGPSPSGSE